MIRAKIKFTNLPFYKTIFKSFDFFKSQKKNV